MHRGEEIRIGTREFGKSEKGLGIWNWELGIGNGLTRSTATKQIEDLSKLMKQDQYLETRIAMNKGRLEHILQLLTGKECEQKHDDSQVFDKLPTSKIQTTASSRGSGKYSQLIQSTPRWAVANGAGVILSVYDKEVARYEIASLTAAAVPALQLPTPTTALDEHLVAGLPALEPYACLFHRYYAIATPSATQRFLLGLLEAPPWWATDALDATVQFVELLRAAEDYTTGETLVDEISNGGAFVGIKCPPITREEFGNACGVEDFHDETNYSRTACVIAVSKARDTFEPFLYQLGCRLLYILKRLLLISIYLIQKDGEFLSGHNVFLRRVASAFNNFAESTERACREKCLEDLVSITRYVSWSLHNKNRAGLRHFLDSFGGIEPSSIAVNSTSPGNSQDSLIGSVAAEKHDTKPRAYTKLSHISSGIDSSSSAQTAETDLLDSTLWNRRLGPSSEKIVYALEDLESTFPDDNKLVLLASLSDSLEYVADSIERLVKATPLATLNHAESGKPRNKQTSSSPPRDLASFADEYRKLAIDCLKVMHVEMQLETIFHLQELIYREYLENQDAEEPDDIFISLTAQITRKDEEISPFVAGMKWNYIFGGICSIVVNTSLKALADMKSINLFGVQQICQNSIALEQALAAIPSIDSEAIQQSLDHIRTYFELLNMPFEALLAFITEHRHLFTVAEYSNLLKVKIPGREIPPNTQGSFQGKGNVITIWEVNKESSRNQLLKQLLNLKFFQKTQARLTFFAQIKLTDRGIKTEDRIYLKFWSYHQTSLALRKGLRLATRVYGTVIYSFWWKVFVNLSFLYEGVFNLKKQNQAITQLLLQWTNLRLENITGENYIVFKAIIPGFDPWEQGSFYGGGIFMHRGEEIRIGTREFGKSEKGLGIWN
ncbi:Dynamin-like protein ARC5 [Hibiscus syriacus]|uniref:Exocyst complex component Sec8 n=1 Tax=Hibiscus syriacus TaxID=106335 RepID=A0A6A3BQ25_HIBSY|nr:Dynamin-like protein ARC5 [Hibiscus syriacus]